MNEISALKEEVGERPSHPTGSEGAFYEAPDTTSARTLILDLPAFRIVQNKSPPFESYPVYVI